MIIVESMANPEIPAPRGRLATERFTMRRDRRVPLFRRRLAGQTKEENPMGSVIVNWEGTCRDRTVQEELVAYLRRLADRSAARLQGPAPVRPAFLELLTAQREHEMPSLEPIRMFDQEIQGAIVLEPGLTTNLDALVEDVERTGVEKIGIAAGGAEKQEAFCLSIGPGSAPCCLRLSRLRLFGIDFELFDPRNLYPTENRMSFVFLDSPDLSSLCGCLAQVETREQCQVYDSEVIRAADWFVSGPKIHLRYHLEEWTDMLLSWVKYFFVPDLHYYRYEPMANYDRVRVLLEEKSQTIGRDATKQSAFEALLDGFETGADEWIAKLSDMA
jgi:hypothetical protein